MNAEEMLYSDSDEFHLACVLLAPSGQSHLGNVLDQVSPEDFYDPHYGLMWQAARNIYNAGGRISKRTLLIEVDTPAVRGRLDRISGEPVYGTKLPQSVRVVVENARLRRLVQTADRIIQRSATAEDYSQAYEMATKELQALEGGEVPEEVVSFSALADQWFDSMSGAGESATIVPTPWDEANDLMAGGMHSGRFYVVAARPGAGKSILGLNVAANAAEQGYSSLVFSVEMGNLEVAGRIMAAGGQAEYGEITRYELSAETDRRVREYAARNRDMPLAVVDKAGVTIEYIAAVARTHKRTKGLDLLVVDYLQLLEASDKARNRQEQLSHISRTMKLLSRELGCAVVAACQLNRENTKTNRRPTMADIRESGAIEQDADVVMLLHHELIEDKPTGMVDVIIDKNRTGRTGDVTLPWRGHQARIGY